MENKDALAEVEERLRSTKNRRMYERLQTVRLRIMGMPVNEIAGSCPVPRKRFAATSIPMKPKGYPVFSCASLPDALHD